MFERLAAILLLLLGLWSAPALAAGIEIRDATLLPGDEGYELSANFTIELPPSLEDAVNHGVTLHFLVEFELLRPRWYWFDERSARRSQTWRLSYHALTRQYRLTSGALHQNFASLADAVSVLSRVRRWQVLERKEVSVGENYQATVRLRLDLSQMAKPFQINALANRDWDLASPPAAFAFSPSPLPPADSK